MTVLGGGSHPPLNGVGPTDRERISPLASGHVGTARCCEHLEMRVEEVSKSEGRAVGHVTCTELVAGWAFSLIKADQLEPRERAISEPCRSIRSDEAFPVKGIRSE
ncbi:hypothetical protein Rs2_17090 [Raphanus sativus]|nr:hypothetical protein Rs2_17090 [Raphanus sativus]